MSESSSEDPKDRPKEAVSSKRRRRFLKIAARAGMAGGLVAGYGAFAAVAGRYLYPSEDPDRRWMFVAEIGGIAPGTALRFVGPSGETINVTRLGDAGELEDFIALTTVCPHLGCQVHWEENKDRFFCPCHGGVFTPQGKAIEGPPAKAGQWLERFPLKLEGGLLYVEVKAP